jgi:hypothetical protein
VVSTQVGSRQGKGGVWCGVVWGHANSCAAVCGGGRYCWGCADVVDPLREEHTGSTAEGMGAVGGDNKTVLAAGDAAGKALIQTDTCSTTLGWQVPASLR